MEINTINPTFIEHEGYFYLEYEGEFYKGCKRCGGEGHYSYNGEHSRCFMCDDTSAKLGERLADRAAAEKWCYQRRLAAEVRARKKERDRLQRVAFMEENQRGLLEEDPEVYEFLMGIIIEQDTQEQFDTYEEWEASQMETHNRLEKDGFIRTMAEVLRWVGPSRKFTPKMIAAVRKVMERRAAQAAEAAAAEPIPEGRQRVTGVVASIKVVDTDFGMTVKVLVKDDRGFKVYGTLANALADAKRLEFGEGTEGTWLNLAAGCRVAFTATLKPSSDDPSFGFASRPSKGEWL